MERDTAARAAAQDRTADHTAPVVNVHPHAPPAGAELPEWRDLVRQNDTQLRREAEEEARRAHADWRRLLGALLVVHERIGNGQDLWRWLPVAVKKARLKPEHITGDAIGLRRIFAAELEARFGELDPIAISFRLGDQEMGVLQALANDKETPETYGKAIEVVFRIADRSLRAALAGWNKLFLRDPKAASALSDECAAWRDDLDALRKSGGVVKDEPADHDPYSLVALSTLHCEKPPPPTLWTGIPDLDREGGGIDSGAAVILNGPTGKGKTGLLLQICRNIALTADDVVILYLAAELTYPQIVARLIAQEMASREPSSAVAWRDLVRQTGPGFTGRHLAYLTPYEKRFAIRKIRPATDARTMGVMLRTEVEAAARKSGGKRVVLALDYLQKLTDGLSDGDKRTATEHLSETIRALCDDMNTTALVVCRTAKSLKARTATIDDKAGAAKESGNIAYDGGYEAFIAADNQSRTADGLCRAILTVTKWRSGPQEYDIPLLFNAPAGLFLPERSEYADPIARAIARLTGDDLAVYECIRDGAKNRADVMKALKARPERSGKGIGSDRYTEIVGRLSANHVITEHPYLKVRS